MKKYIFGILAVAMAIGFSAFTTKKAPKPFVDTIFYYTGTEKQVEAGLTHSIVPSVLGASANWTDEADVYNLNGGNYLGAMSFVKSTTPDAVGHVGDDGTLTIAEAASALRAYYEAPNPDNFANSSFQVGTGTPATINIYRKSTND